MQQPEYKLHITYLDPFSIIVREGMDRYRKDMGELKDLAESIRSKGQIHPITLTNSNELVAGGRRLAACMMLGIQIACVHRDELTDFQLRELEFEENLQRKNFSPAEEVTAIADLHRLKQQIYGTPTSGREGGWTLEDTAKLMGKSKGSVIDAIALADAIKVVPELSGAKDKSAIRKQVKNMKEVLKRVEATTAYNTAVEAGSGAMDFNLRHVDGLLDMRTIADASIDLLLTDPPYGIDVFEQISATHLHHYDDSVDKALAFYKELAHESFRFTKPSSHAYIFCSIDHFNTIKAIFEAVGWDVSIKPIIWIKRASGQNNWPTRYPSHCYELILYARRVDSTLVKQGYPDWIQCDPIIDSTRVHQAQKPITLLRELISRSVLPMSTLYDPCAGSGSSLLAGLEENLLVSGSEIDQAAYAAACTNYSNWSSLRLKKGN